MCPAGRIAARSLREMPITFEAPRAIFSSSPSVLTSRRLGEDPRSLGSLPTRHTESSVTLLMDRPSLGTTAPEHAPIFVTKGVRSNQPLLMMPLADVVAPLRKVERPTAVT